jgi:hypothetical protein
MYTFTELFNPDAGYILVTNMTEMTETTERTFSLEDSLSSESQVAEESMGYECGEKWLSSDWKKSLVFMYRLKWSGLIPGALYYTVVCI